MTTEAPELAFYYPGAIWRESDWLKNLILFFDGIALLVPEYMRDRAYFFDPSLVSGLEQRGLLTILEPETLIDKDAAAALASAMTDIITSGLLDALAKGRTPFVALSRSRLGYMADSGLAEMIHEELQRRGLAGPSTDNVTIPMHPLVHSLVLILLAQILVPTGEARGMSLFPTTDRPDIQAALVQMLNLPSIASAGHVVSFDLETVGVDLSAVPIDEVLSFRSEHGEEYRSYARDLRQFVRQLNYVPKEEQGSALLDRKQEIEAAAKRLKDLATDAWKRPATFGLGLAGAVWRVQAGDIFGGLLVLGASLLSASLRSSTDVGAYFYLFRAQERFSQPRRPS